MYIMINNVIGKERIDLSFRVQGKEVAVVIMLSNNVQYWLKEPVKIRLKTSEDVVLSKGVYTDKELNATIGPELKLGIKSCDYILRTNKLENVTEIAISLEELNNSNNLKDGRPSNTLFTYYVTGSEYFMHFEPTPHNTRNSKVA